MHVRDYKRENAYEFSKVTLRGNQTNVFPKEFPKGDHHRESGLLSICRGIVPGCVRAVSHSLSSPCRSAETSYWKRGHEGNAYEEDFTYNNVNSTCINSCRREPQ